MDNVSSSFDPKLKQPTVFVLPVTVVFLFLTGINQKPDFPRGRNSQLTLIFEPRSSPKGA